MLHIKGFHVIYVLFVFVENSRRSYAHKKQRNRNMAHVQTPFLTKILAISRN